MHIYHTEANSLKASTQHHFRHRSIESCASRILLDGLDHLLALSDQIDLVNSQARGLGAHLVVHKLLLHAHPADVLLKQRVSEDLLVSSLVAVHTE